MYEDIAWQNFEKTGNLESFLEYKQMLKVKEEIGLINVEGIANESSKNKGDSDKGSNI